MVRKKLQGIRRSMKLSHRHDSRRPGTIISQKWNPAVQQQVHHYQGYDVVDAAAEGLGQLAMQSPCSGSHVFQSSSTFPTLPMKHEGKETPSPPKKKEKNKKDGRSRISPTPSSLTHVACQDPLPTTFPGLFHLADPWKTRYRHNSI